MFEGRTHVTFMQDETDTEAWAQNIRDTVDRMLEPFGKKLPTAQRGFGRPTLSQILPIDISKPNQHDSKAEFLAEQRAVEAALNSVSETVRALTPRTDDDYGDEQRQMLDRLRPIIDEKLLRLSQAENISDATSLARQNVALSGGFTTSLFVLLDLWSALGDRQQELKDQERRFWNLDHKAPNYYARTIALRLAKLYGQYTGQRPTVGTSALTGDPSTSFSRALKDIFLALNINGTVRPYASWAIDQLTEEDLQPPETLGGLLGTLTNSSQETRNLLADYMNQKGINKGSGK